MVTPLTHDQGPKACGKIAMYATDEWLAKANEQSVEFQCLGCDRLLMVSATTAGAEVDEASL